MFKRLLIGFFLFTAVVVSAFFYRSYRNQAAETVSPRRGEIVEAIYALGKVKTKRQFDLKVGVLTTVEKLFVREGDSVRKSAPLIKFLESGVFRSPFDGVVTLVAVDEGEPASPSVSVLRVDDLKDKYVEVSLEQQGALRVQKNQIAEVVFESLRGEKLPGKVVALYSKNDEFLADIEVAGLKENVLPGMTADVAIIVDKRRDALLIPVRTVNNGHVIVQREKKKVKLPVTLGAIDGQMAEVISGDLRETDVLIIGGK